MLLPHLDGMRSSKKDLGLPRNEKKPDLDGRLELRINKNLENFETVIVFSVIECEVVVLKSALLFSFKQSRKRVKEVRWYTLYGQAINLEFSQGKIENTATLGLEQAPPDQDII